MVQYLHAFPSAHLRQAVRQVQFPQVRCLEHHVVENLAVDEAISGERNVPASLELENTLAVVAADVPGRENGVGLDLEDFEVGRPPDDVLELLLTEDAVAEVNFLDIETWWW
jgi:hypothetical protein